MLCALGHPPMQCVPGVETIGGPGSVLPCINFVYKDTRVLMYCLFSSVIQLLDLYMLLKFVHLWLALSPHR